MKERLKRLRKYLDLTQQEFAERLGIKRNTVATYEGGKSNPSDSAVALICREFNVNEEWLRNGHGEMIKPAPTDVLDRLAQQYKLTNGACIAVEKFVNMQPKAQNIFIDLCLEIAAAITEDETDPYAKGYNESYDYNQFSEDKLIQTYRNMPKTPEQLEKDFPPIKKKNSDAG